MTPLRSHSSAGTGWLPGNSERLSHSASNVSHRWVSETSQQLCDLRVFVDQATEPVASDHRASRIREYRGKRSKRHLPTQRPVRPCGLPSRPRRPSRCGRCVLSLSGSLVGDVHYVKGDGRGKCRGQSSAGLFGGRPGGELGEHRLQRRGQRCGAGPREDPDGAGHEVAPGIREVDRGLTGRWWDGAGVGGCGEGRWDVGGPDGVDRSADRNPARFEQGSREDHGQDATGRRLTPHDTTAGRLATKRAP